MCRGALGGAQAGLSTDCAGGGELAAAAPPAPCWSTCGGAHLGGHAQVGHSILLHLDDCPPRQLIHEVLPWDEGGNLHAADELANLLAARGAAHLAVTESPLDDKARGSLRSWWEGRAWPDIG